jgi:hypothetical protein
MKKILYLFFFVSFSSFSQINSKNKNAGYMVISPNGIYSQKENDLSDTSNITIGNSSFKNYTSAENNIAIGRSAMLNSNASNNIGIGKNSLKNADNIAVSDGNNNVAVGHNTLRNLTYGASNLAMGDNALNDTNGYYNTAIGNMSASGYVTGHQNTTIGYMAGSIGTPNPSHQIEGNVFLGFMAGRNVSESNKLYIANSDTDRPLIWGDFLNAKLGFHGKVGVGTKNPLTNLHVYQVAGHSQILLNNSNVGGTLTDGLSLISDTNGDAHILNKENKPLNFGANNFGSYMTVYPAGEVGIGLLGFLPSANLHLHETEAGQATKFKISNAFSSLYGNDGFMFEYSTQGEMLMNNLETQNIILNSNPYNSTPEIFVAGSSRVGIGTNNPGTKFEVNGFTKLGSDAPSIKIKKLTTTTGSNDDAGNLTTIPTGVTATKIIGIQVLVEYGPGQYVPSSYIKNGGYEFNFATNNINEIEIWNILGNSYHIYSKPIKIIITYEE